MSFVLDAFSSDLTQRALLGGLLAATTTALIGTWVVVRGPGVLRRRPRPRRAARHRPRRHLGLRPHARGDRQRRRDGRRHQPRPPHDPPARGHRHRAAVRRDARPRRRHHQPRADVRRRPHGVPVRRRARRAGAGAAAGGGRAGRSRWSASSSATGRSSPWRAGGTRRPRSACARASPTPPCSALLALAVVSSFRAVGTLLVFGLLVAPPAAAQPGRPAAADDHGDGGRARVAVGRRSA